MMAVINEIIRMEEDKSISFGNYVVVEKQKISDFEANGDAYNVRTHKDITKLEKNGSLLFESVPGSSVHNLKMGEKIITFSIEGFEDTQITMELEPEKEYKIYIDDFNVGKMKAKLSGKISFSSELKSDAQFVKIERL